jgi:RNA polymerase sigma-70 factor, ECF subfamily
MPARGEECRIGASAHMNTAELFEALAVEHYASLFRFGVSLTRSEAEAQDLTQQTFLTWATKGHQLRDPLKAKAWLFSTLHRAFLRGHQRQSKLSYQSLDEALEVASPAVHPGAPVDASWALVALTRVDDVYRAAVSLFYLEDWSYLEIAAILQVPVGTVKSRISRGVEQLRRLLSAPDWDGPVIAAPGPAVRHGTSPGSVDGALVPVGVGNESSAQTS